MMTPVSVYRSCRNDIVPRGCVVQNELNLAKSDGKSIQQVFAFADFCPAPHFTVYIDVIVITTKVS